MSDAPMIHCLGNKQGPNLVLQHGWGIDSTIWQPLCRLLEQRYRLWLLDWPGYGGSAALSDPADLAVLADRVLPRLPERASWLGWSLGGMLATHLAQQAPQRLERLILLGSNPAFVARSDWPTAMPSEQFTPFTEAFADKPGPTLKRFMALQLQGEPDNRALLRQLQQLQLTQPAPDTATLQAGLDWLAQLDGRATLADLNVPVCHLLGEADPLVPVALAKRLEADYPWHEIRCLPACGHAPMLSCPGRLAAELDAVLLREAS